MIIGINGLREREHNDFYATDPVATMLMLDKIDIKGNVLEPNCGMGHISEVLIGKGFEVYSTDLINRGYGNETGIDFLVHDYKKNFDNVVMNPPFKDIEKFISRAIDISNDKVIVFARIQLLESKKRKRFLEETKPSKVLVHSERVACWKGGNEFDENGKRWSSAQCYAWFVWEKGYTGKPVIELL